jgi:hypothetical protein
VGDPAGAFFSDCTGWHQPTYFFGVRIENRSSLPLPLSLADLFVVDRDGGSHQPTDVTEGDRPAGFLPDSTNIAPHASLSGLVAFDASEGFTPARFQLITGGEVLTIRFRGQETVELPFHGGLPTGE